jgi:hypothetical protein
MAVRPLTREARDVSAELDALEARYADLAARLLVVEARTGARDAADAAVVPAIALAIGARYFACSELFKHARHDRALDAALRAADITNPKQLGKLLWRLQGQSIGGLRLVRCKLRHGVRRWVCVVDV